MPLPAPLLDVWIQLCDAIAFQAHPAPAVIEKLLDAPAYDNVLLEVGLMEYEHGGPTGIWTLTHAPVPSIDDVVMVSAIDESEKDCDGSRTESNDVETGSRST